MGEILGETLAYTLLFSVAAGVGLLIRKFIHARDLRAMPSARHRALLLAQLRDLRGGGAKLDACVAELRRQGLRKGVAEGLVIDFERQQQADVAHPRKAEWRGSAFHYPGNWKLAPLVADAGTDPGVSIEGIGSALLLLVAEDGVDSGYRELVRQQETQITDPQRTPVDRWGPLEGVGVRLSGPHRTLHLLVEVLVLRPHDVDVPFCLIQFHSIEEEQLVRPGFQLIQDTWR